MNKVKKSIEWRPASTVILSKEEREAFLVYLLRRSKKSGFFPGYYVFPGGSVDPEDRMDETWSLIADLNQVNWLKRFGGGMTKEEAFAYAVSAIRETFEEAGVLLIDQTDTMEQGLERLRARRRGEGLPRGWFRESIEAEGWPLTFSSIAPWTHWITPRLMRSHFDTRFFVAFMPTDQVCSPDDEEMVHGIWVSPRKGLEGNHSGEIPLSPPTLVTLHELLTYEKLSDLKREAETRSWGDARFPRLVPLKEGALILQPWDPMRYGEVNVDTKKLEKMILPVGEPFSRLWLHEGIWRPVRV